jgi:D-alanyl-lipoteichoic acid acyltransferase DltB (MBOAT superfamily)
VTFIQYEFLVLMTLVFTTYWLLPSRRLQNVLLLLVSAVFYGWIHPWFLFLLYGSAILDYFMGLGMIRFPSRKRLFLIISMCGNLGLLGYFKYFDFFVENIIGVFDQLGLQTDLHTLGIFLPVGISFYTFQTMSYTIDVYRGDCKPRKNFLDYVVFVSFFPQLVAGPVERAKNLLAQVETPRVFAWAMVRSGFGLAMWGAFKKMIVADTVAPYVNKAFLLSEPSGPLIWAATLGFTVQILADFSGYTDIARGIARMLGFELVENFKNPYLAKNPSQFWRRWHVSFSTWIRDYLYFTFGGSRGTFARTTMATFIAMLLSGLWHGAAWTFVIWGGFHAILLTGYRLVVPRIPGALKNMPGAHSLAVGIMFGFTVFGWMIFRETSLDRLLYYLSLDPFSASPEQWVATAVMLGVVAAVSAPLIIALLVDRFVRPKLVDTMWYLPLQTTTWALYAVGMFIFVRQTTNDFIYFQF